LSGARGKEQGAGEYLKQRISPKTENEIVKHIRLRCYSFISAGGNILSFGPFLALIPKNLRTFADAFARAAAMSFEND